MSHRHPAPWAYDRVGDDLRANVLEDANGKTILRGGEMATISFYSAEARVTTEAAGEMEDLLRRARGLLMRYEIGSEVERLLARIDAAKAGT